MEVIKAKVTPARKRVLHAEQFFGALNWAKYLEQYQLNISGPYWNKGWSQDQAG